MGQALSHHVMFNGGHHVKRICHTSLRMCWASCEQELSCWNSSITFLLLEWQNKRLNNVLDVHGTVQHFLKSTLYIQMIVTCLTVDHCQEKKCTTMLWWKSIGVFSWPILKYDWHIVSTIHYNSLKWPSDLYDVVYIPTFLKHLSLKKGNEYISAVSHLLAL